MNKNNMFQSGTFDGYKAKGRCRVLKEFKHQVESNSIKPVSGSFMAILDDPNLIEDDLDGTRLPDFKVSGDYSEKQPVNLSKRPNNYQFFGPGGIITASIDGAYLEIIEPVENGTTVRILWKFLIGEQKDNGLGLNDFALVEIFNASNRWMGGKILKQTTDIPSGSWSSGWESFTWQARGRFTARIRIAVCNGYRFSNSEPPTRSQLRAARSFPSGLLIDSVTIKK